MKNASWAMALLLGGLLYFTLTHLPLSGEASSGPASHLSLRYAQNSASETGIPSPAGAVLADYRGFDLLLMGLLFSTASMVLLLFFSGASHPVVFFPALLWLGGTALILGVGFLSLLHGGNFLDYESLAGWVGPLQARREGALILTGGVLLNLGGFLLLFLHWLRTPEASHDR